MAELGLKISEGIALEFQNHKDDEKKPRKRHKRSSEVKRPRPKGLSAKERVIKAIEKDGGRYINTAKDETDVDGEIGLLVCGVEYNGGIYFMYINKDRQIKVIEHSNTYRLVREVPSEMNVLNYIYMKQRNELRQYMVNFIEANEDFNLITDIAIRPQKPRKDKKDDKRNRPDSKKDAAQKKV